MRNVGASLSSACCRSNSQSCAKAGHAHPDEPRRARQAPLIGRAVDDRERLLDPADEALAVRRHAHAARMTFEQRHAEPVLDGSHAPADRAVRDAGHLGRRQKRAVTRDRADGLEARERRSRARLRQRPAAVRRTVATAEL
jgi:hypothetical protein